MNSALLYLRFTLSKRRTIRFAQSLTNPGKCIGLLALAGLAACLIHVSDDPVFDRLFQPSSLTALATIWMTISVFHGFMRRGLVFEPADIEFLIPGPFRLRDLLHYRLLPGYSNALLAGALFFALAEKRFTNPIWVAVAVALLQLLCAHLSMMASILAGTFSRRTSLVARLILSLILVVLGGFYLGSLSRTAQDQHAILWRLPSIQTALDSIFLGQSSLQLAALCALAAGGVAASWLGLSLLKDRALETSVAQSEMTASEPSRTHPSDAKHHRSNALWFRSVSLLFTGARSLLWKQWLQALRTKREIFYAATITIAYTIAIKIGADGHIADFNAASETGLVSTEEHQGWMMLAAINATIWIGFLGWILQRTCPFDFRSDSRRIAELRILPFPPFATVLAQLAMPVLLTLIFQFTALISLTWTGAAQVRALWFALAAFPALAFGFHATGNIFCLLFANRDEDNGGSTASAGFIKTFLMMALSLGVIAPSAAVYIKLSHSLAPVSAFFISAGVQYWIDALLVMILARLFQRCELARELQ